MKGWTAAIDVTTKDTMSGGKKKDDGAEVIHSRSKENIFITDFLSITNGPFLLIFDSSQKF